MRPSGTHLYKRVGPSVCWSIRPSVCPLRFLENRSFRHYSVAAMLRFKPNTLWDALRLIHLSVRLSICPSIYLTCPAPKSIHTETQSGRIFARSGLFIYVWSHLFIALPFCVVLTDNCQIRLDIIGPINSRLRSGRSRNAGGQGQWYKWVGAVMEICGSCNVVGQRREQRRSHEGDDNDEDDQDEDDNDEDWVLTSASWVMSQS